MKRVFLLMIAMLMAAAPAQAYVGPGAGLGALAASVALVLGFVLLIVGFVWFPIRRRMRNRKAARDGAKSQTN